MRFFIAASLTGLALASLAACNNPSTGGNASAPAGAPGATGAPAPAGASVVPQRKPGLWRQVMSMDGQSMQGPGMQLCVDANSEARMSAFASTASAGAHCPAPQMTRNADGSISFSSTCTLTGGGTSTTTGVIHGDFNTSYTVDSDTVMSGSSVAAMNGDHKMTITGTWTGPCPAGERGGDLTMPNGMTRNVLDDEGGAPANSAANATGG